MSVTDKETFTAMLDHAGVKYTLDTKENTLEIYGDDGPKNEGYTAFVAVFHFTEDGKLEKVGVWE